jgi:DNA-directed RNA polymerase specialized sigma24 family protein
MKRGFIEKYGLARSEWLYIISQRISNERDREIFERAYLDGVPYEQVAVEFDMSVRQIKSISQGIEKELLKHIVH